MVVGPMGWATGGGVGNRHSPRASEIVVNQWNEQICMNTIQYNTMWICKWNVNFEQSNNLLMAGGLFLCLNQVMLSSSLSRHQGLVLDHCKNEYRHRYTKTKSIQVPRSLHLKWVRGEEFFWSSWRCRSVATDRSSHPVGLSEEEERKWLIALWSIYISGIKGLYHYFSRFSAPSPGR